MKEDIKILEWLINRWQHNKAGLEKEAQAIENLLKRYKELEEEVESQDKTIDNLIECQTEREKYTHSLEEENAMLKKANNIAENVTVEDITKVMNKSLEEFKREFIPISVIQNKINEEIKYHEKNISDIENITMFVNKTDREQAEIKFNEYAITVLNKLLAKLLEERNQ